MIYASLMTIFRRFAAIPVAASFFLAALAGPTLAEPKAVVELFTSQGCSSCPPADSYLGELVDRDDVIALSVHVDYWDYIGWKDTFGSPDNSLRQRAYAIERGDRRVYTPQMVINGGEHYVGSNKRAVERGLKSASLPLKINVSETNGAIHIEIDDASELTDRHTTVRLVTYSSKVPVKIARGENHGRTITYHNIVRSMRPIGMWEGSAMKIDLPVHEIMSKDVSGCVIIVQEDGSNGPGRILGAAVLPRPST